MNGLENEDDLNRLEQALRNRYSDADVDLITSQNAIRVLRDLWQ